MQNEHRDCFQIMCGSTEKELIDFIETAGFVCKRKCYECEVTKVDVKSQKTSRTKLFLCADSGTDYWDVCRLSYHQYALKHEAINPLTVSEQEFFKNLPKQVYIEKEVGRIINFAFVEGNEIAYVGSVNPETYLDFVVKVVEVLFSEYETICFECDDTDWETMQLKELFVIEDNESYNTYILERTEK